MYGGSDLFLSNHFPEFYILECSISSILVSEYTSWNRLSVNWFDERVKQEYHEMLN